MDWLTLILRVLHIGAGIFWVGSAFLFFFFIEPSIHVLPPDSRQTFFAEAMGRRRLPWIIFGASVVTVLAGLVLYVRDSAGFNVDWITTPIGIGFTLGALAALVSFFIGALVILPTILNLGALGNKLAAERRPPTPDEEATLGGLERRLQVAGRWDLAGLSLAVLFMAAARYL